MLGEKKNYKLKTSNLRCSQGQFPFPSILGHKQSVFWPLQPFCSSDKRCSGQCWPSWVCHTSQRHSHPSFYQETPCEKIRVSSKCHTEVLSSSWRQLPDCGWGWGSGIMLYSRERVIRPPGAHGKRHTGSSCLASCFRKSSLTIFHKNSKAPKGGGLTKSPKPKLVSSSMGFPGPKYISGASRDHNIYPSSPFPNFSSFISLIFLSPNSQIIFEAVLWLPSPGLHSSYPLGGQCLPTLLGGGVKKLGYLPHLKCAAGSVGLISFSKGPFHIWNRLEVIIGVSC